MLCSVQRDLLVVFLAGIFTGSGEGLANGTAFQPIDILTPLPLTGPWSGGRTMMLSARIAEAVINEEQAILPGYRLTNHFYDDKCSSQESQKILLREATSRDTYVAVTGAGCDGVCRDASFVADSMRLPFLSYECAGEALSSTVDYPGLTRMGTRTASGFTTVIGQLKDMYAWQHIAVITGNPAVYETKALAFETDMQALQITTERHSVYEDSTRLLEDIRSIFELLKRNKRRVVYVLADETLYRKFICGFILAKANKGITWLSDGTWRHQWWRRTDTLVSFNMRWILQDAQTATLRAFFLAIKQAWDEYGDTDDVRREGLQASYVTDQKDFLDFAQGDELYHSVHRSYHSTFRGLLYDRNYYDIFIFDLNGNLIYSVFKELDFATNFRRGGGGKWSETGLADAFELALADPRAVHATPWEPYGPSFGALASFLATGLFGPSGNLLGVFSIQLHPSARAIEHIEPECSLEAIEDNFEGAINVAGLGKPIEQDMDKPLSCFQNHTARTFNELIRKHIEEGYPSGDVGSIVDDPNHYVAGNGADATCVLAYAIKYLLDEGFTLQQIQGRTQEVYDKFQTHIREHIDFDGVSGRVEFSGK